MLSNPKLYAVVSHKPEPAKHKRTAGEIRTEKLDEFRAKKAIDRADAILTRLEARAASYARQIASLQKRKAYALGRAERVSDSIIARMRKASLTRADGFHKTFMLRDAPAALAIDDESLIPREYMREKLIAEPMKVEIKAALARGEEIAGVHLTQKVSLLRK